MKCKKIITGLCVFAMLVSLGASPAQQLSDSIINNFAITADAASVSVNATDVTIYGLSQSYEEFISIPDSVPQSFQIEVTGASDATYKVTSGSSVTVSDTGVITPYVQTYYWYGNIGYSSPISGQTPTQITQSVSFGDSVVRVTAGGENFYINVTLKNYAETYADQVIEDYISQNITDTMTEYEKLEQACKFVAGFDYSENYSTMTGMILSGGGDCWASTQTILTLCKKLGITAWSRKANQDPGAGSGHRNVMAIADGKYYQADAGYTGTAPRYYSVTERTSLYSYKYNSTYGGYEIYQYDGQQKLAVQNVPSEINGNKIIGIGEDFLYYDSTVTQVVLPSTIKYIGDSAFNSCSSLESINIPSSVQSIGSFAFSNCNSLTDIACDSENEYFTASDGVIYNKDKTQLIFAPAVESLTLPSTVKTIGYYSFYYNKNLKSIVIPSSVTTLEEGAFGDCTSLESVTINGSSLETIKDYAFAVCSSLDKIQIPESVTTIGSNAFYRTSNVVIYCYADSTAYTFATENEFEYCLVEKTASGLTPDTIYRQKTTAVDGYYAARFIQMVKKTDLENVTSITYTITDGTNTKTITGTSCFAAVTASGSSITADTGYVFVGIIVTGIPESSTLTCQMTFETAQ